MRTFEQIIATLAADWDLGAPTTPAQRARARGAVKNLPIELEQLYAAGDGAYVRDVTIFSIDDELVDTNAERTRTTRPFVFFATDGGDGVFAIDTQGKLKRGVGAVFWAERGSTQTRTFVYCGANLAAFLDAVIAGQTSWKAPSLERADANAMIAALAAHRDRWTGGPAVDEVELFDTGFRVNVRLPNALRELLKIGNGIVFQAPGVALYTCDRIGAVEGAVADDLTGALWIGEAGDSRYALTLSGWRGSAGEEVVRVAPGEQPATAPIIGPLPAVVIAWLDGRKP
jgi:hypothetical protein